MITPSLGVAIRPVIKRLIRAFWSEISFVPADAGVVPVGTARKVGDPNAPKLSLVCPESYRLLIGESPILVTVRRPGSRHPVQPGDWLY